MTDKIREKFVAWLESLGVGYDVRFTDFIGGLGDGEFYDAEVQGLWTTWQASCAALLTENEELKHKVSAGIAREWDLRSQVSAAKESRARVVESNKALRKCSSRYRWFRDCGGEWNDVMVLDSHGRIICEELDERIDAAMGREKASD